MGSSTSTYVANTTNLNVSTTIANNTATINQAMNEISSTSIQNLLTTNTTQETEACTGGNTFVMTGCTDMTGNTVNSNQNISILCVQQAISTMNSNTAAKNNFYSDIVTKFATAVSNDSKLAAAVAMNNSLSKVASSSGLNGLLDGVSGAMSHSMDDLTGASINTADVLKASTKVNQLITNSVSTTNSTKNVVNNINSQSSTINNNFDCDLIANADNTADISACSNWVGNVINNKQNNSVSATQNCAAKYITTEVLTNSNVVKALTDMVNSATDINSSSVSVQSNSDLSDFNKVSGSFLSDLGLSGLFSGTFGHVLFWVILIIIIIIIIVIIYKVYEANKSTNSYTSSSSRQNYDLGTTNSNNSNQLM